MIPKAPQMIPVTEYLVSPSIEVNNNTSSGGSTGSHSSSLLFYLSVLKDKLSHVQTLVGVLVSPQQKYLPESSTSMAISTMNSTIQEIIVAATSIRFTCQQMMALGSTPGTSTTTCTEELHHHHQIDHHDHRLLPPHQLNFANNNSNRGVVSNIGLDIRGQSFFSNSDQADHEALDWFSEGYNNSNCNFKDDDRCVAPSEANINSKEGLLSSENETDIIELDAEDLLARYTHFCQVCGKGFKRDANLRMHMRAHGDEYKTNAALSNPMKNKLGMMSSSLGEGSGYLNNSMKPQKYSCPHEGCRWNKKHARFQPLKSMVCVKNHYKRSHCPKMYVCKRCNQKHFSVLSDLRTHEKHCGDPKWQCSCGTTFSRKDKLMGHVALFFGHTPLINGLSHSGKSEERTLQHQIGGSSRSCV